MINFTFKNDGLVETLGCANQTRVFLDPSLPLGNSSLAEGLRIQPQKQLKRLVKIDVCENANNDD